eukprot:2893730-Rhodomonas_salina.9
MSVRDVGTGHRVGAGESSPLAAIRPMAPPMSAGISLRAPYAMPGTGIACAFFFYHACGTDIGWLLRAC